MKDLTVAVVYISTTNLFNCWILIDEWLLFFATVLQIPCSVINLRLLGCQVCLWSKPACSFHKERQTFVQRASPVRVCMRSALCLAPFTQEYSSSIPEGYWNIQYVFLAWEGNEPHLKHHATKCPWSQCKSAISLLWGLRTESYIISKFNHFT